MRTPRNSAGRWVILVLLVILAVAVVWRQHSRRRRPAKPAATSPAQILGKSGKAPKIARQKRPVPRDTATGPVVRPPDVFPRAAASWLEAQIELARRGFSSGSIDGVPGAQSAAALRAFQESEDISPSGVLDADTRGRLIVSTPPFTQVSITTEDLAGLQPLSTTWLGKSQQTSMAYETVLEMLAERSHAHPSLIRQLNPGVDWTAVAAGTTVKIPAIGAVTPGSRATELHISLGDHVLQAIDDQGHLIVHCPVSIARDVEKRPLGELHVTVIIPNPNYTFDPDVFPESEEGRELGRKLVIPPGPNNPVGVAWIGLDRPGYGIHGTPSPEQVGRTESHGCFRLANWDASMLVDMCWVGLPVYIDP